MDEKEHFTGLTSRGGGRADTSVVDRAGVQDVPTAGAMPCADDLKETPGTMTTTAVHPVDEKLPTGRLAVLGLQHVLVMYAGAVAVPLIVGRALKLTPEQVARRAGSASSCRS